MRLTIRADLGEYLPACISHGLALSKMLGVIVDIETDTRYPISCDARLNKTTEQILAEHRRDVDRWAKQDSQSSENDG